MLGEDFLCSECDKHSEVVCLNRISWGGGGGGGAGIFPRRLWGYAPPNKFTYSEVDSGGGGGGGGGGAKRLEITEYQKKIKFKILE